MTEKIIDLAGRISKLKVIIRIMFVMKHGTKRVYLCGMEGFWIITGIIFGLPTLTMGFPDVYLFWKRYPNRVYRFLK